MEPITLQIKTASGGKHSVQVTTLSETVAALKTRLEPVINIPADSQRLIFRGHVLKDDHTLEHVKEVYSLADGHTMHVVRSARAAPAAPLEAQPQQRQPTPTNTAPPLQPRNAHNTRAPQTQNVPATNPFAMFGTGAAAGADGNVNPMAAAFGGMGGGGGMPDMAEMQRTMMQNPEQMQAMLNSPMMDSLMNNPELARSLMLANPQVRELIERNPEVGHVLNDSNTLRQMMQMARNPSLMNEMMRNTDRQMANIEMMPGGFDALRRMHENIQAPLMDAAAGGLTGPADSNNAAAGGAGADNPFASLFQQQNNTPSNAPMPNPWAPNRGIPTTDARDRNVGARLGQAGQGATNPTNNAFASLFEPPNGGTGVGGGAPPLGAYPGIPGTFPGMPGVVPGMPGAVPGMPGAVPGMPNLDRDQIMQFLENPMVQNMMESVLSDPAMMETMVASNPHLQAMIQSNPEMATMLRDPATLRTFLNPGVVRAMMQMRSAIGAAQNHTGGAPTSNTGNGLAATEGNVIPGTGAGVGTGGGIGPGAPPLGAAPSADMDRLFAIMRGLNPNVTPGTGIPLQPEPELTQEQLEPQLAQLRDMGFLDTSMCLEALRQARGNVNLAVEHLLSRFGN